MIQQFFFFNFLTSIVNILLVGTILVYVLYIFIINNRQQKLVVNDYRYLIIKYLLLFILGGSFIIFIIFIFFFYKFFVLSGVFSIFSIFSIIPNIHISFLQNWFEFSVDFFGIVLLLLGYFIGILSLLALDNRVF